METLQNALQKMGSNFIVASFVPAMGFVMFCLLAFSSLVPSSLSFYQQIQSNFTEMSIVVLIFTTLLGFTLFTLSTYIYKSFEGYTFLFKKSTFLGKLGIRRQQKRAKEVELKQRKLDRAIRKIENLIERLEQKASPTFLNSQTIRKYHQAKETLEQKKYALLAAYNAHFPPKELILPTRFGNILRAAEEYPGQRYGIDSVEIWPRLAHVIPLEGMALVDQANNECLFLLNSSLLAAISSFLCLLAAGYQYILSDFIKHNDNPFLFLTLDSSPNADQIYQQIALIYVVLAVFSIACAWFFYEASLLNVGQFGAMIRSSYDLYRFDLLKALKLSFPKNLYEEHDFWQQLSHFYSVGNQGEPKDINLKYSFRKK